MVSQAKGGRPPYEKAIETAAGPSLRSIDSLYGRGKSGRMKGKSQSYRRKASLDRDLEIMSREDLISEVKKLRAGIRVHRDANLHDLCWHHPDLWGLLPEKTDPIPTVPAWPQFLEGCVRYRKSLDFKLKNAPQSKVPYAGEKRPGKPNQRI
jgi:hypothetical protein